MIPERTTFDVLRHDGQPWLCVKYQTTYSDKPVMVTHWWPCQPIANDYATNSFANLVGAQATPEGTGSYRWRRGDYDWLSFPLKDGGQTQPIATIETRIPEPKGKALFRWYFCRWQKYLKAKGWVDLYPDFAAIEKLSPSV